LDAGGAVLLVMPGVSGMALAWFIRLWPSELELVFREIMDSGSWKLGGHESSSKPRAGSGEACTDELVVMTAVSGDMMGEPC
jgi:hypothetical protein